MPVEATAAACLLRCLTAALSGAALALLDTLQQKAEGTIGPRCESAASPDAADSQLSQP